MGKQPEQGVERVQRQPRLPVRDAVLLVALYVRAPAAKGDAVGRALRRLNVESRPGHWARATTNVEQSARAGSAKELLLQHEGEAVVDREVILLDEVRVARRDTNADISEGVQLTAA